MVLNHLLTGVILQVSVSRNTRELKYMLVYKRYNTAQKVTICYLLQSTNTGNYQNQKKHLENSRSQGKTQESLLKVPFFPWIPYTNVSRPTLTQNQYDLNQKYDLQTSKKPKNLKLNPLNFPNSSLQSPQLFLLVSHTSNHSHNSSAKLKAFGVETSLPRNNGRWMRLFYDAVSEGNSRVNQPETRKKVTMDLALFFIRGHGGFDLWNPSPILKGFLIPPLPSTS